MYLNLDNPSQKSFYILLPERKFWFKHCYSSMIFEQIGTIIISYCFYDYRNYDN